MKESADDNFEFDENVGKVSKKVENTVGKEKLLVTSNFSFTNSVFERLVLQTCKNHGMFGKLLIRDFLGCCRSRMCMIMNVKGIKIHLKANSRKYSNDNEEIDIFFLCFSLQFQLQNI